ncbi:Alpha/Beta hydrolase protein [Aspergillus coremiiformis]|uniref:Alpha/Beta hydrolase protein n=1 Tax=Aspergillus coremiiformis TaxID=138285 RepID=A0A5N6ZFC5_9EURO|nr:Alpha/Beta hydrolase protein [Aspergillus coremiiformis]
MGFGRRKDKAPAYPEESHSTTLSTATTFDSNISGTTLVTESLSRESLNQDETPGPTTRTQKVRRSLAKYQSYTDLSSVISQTVVKANATKLKAQNSVVELEHQMRAYVAHTSIDLYGAMLKKLDHVITSMDEGLFRDKDDLITEYGDEVGYTKTEKEGKQPSTGSSFFSKPYLYHNSRLPAHLPPLHLPPHTYALIRLAAQYSSSAYRKPAEPTSTNAYVSANPWHGTKAMIIKPLASDDLQSIVLAIRGTQSFRDWAVNMNTLPTAPQNLLDDAENLCHAGFLTVAEKMIPSLAAHLRDLLTEDPTRASYSLILTGHSAGGAVASLLYCHLHSTTASSELSHVASFFPTIHCITFGAPPISIRPLLPPNPPSIFYAFINEGDPVPRAEKPYITSLLNLYLSPGPFHLDTTRTYPFIRRKTTPATWHVPPTTLALAGHIVLLRTPAADHRTPGPEVEACHVTNELLKDVIFGDPIQHMMGLYMDRIDCLPR